MSLRACIDEAFYACGFRTYGFVGLRALQALASQSDPKAVRRYGLLDSSGAVVAAFPYNPFPPPCDEYSSALCGGGQPYVRVGAFAAYNRYRAMARLLKEAGARIAASTGSDAKRFRALVNSRLPEKTLALMAGLGAMGRSSLLVSHDYGPACLIGALLLPPELPPISCDTDSAAVLSGRHLAAACSGCGACVSACPTHAIDSSGGIDRELCIQFWALRPGELPQALKDAWGGRLYGCDVCVSVCPQSKTARTISACDKAERLILDDERRPGFYVSARFITDSDDETLRTFFHKTALGMSWVGLPELRRNAAMGLTICA